MQRFELSFEKHQNKTALEEGDCHYSYKEFSEHVLFLSGLLRKKNFKKIAIIGDPSFITASSLISAIMSETCYIPIDISWPVIRINDILTSSSAGAVLACPVSLNKYSLNSREFVSPYFFHIRKSKDKKKSFYIQEYFKKRKQKTYFPNSSFKEFKTSKEASCPLSYIMYTSGSSGQPKGVEVKSSALEKFLEWVEREFQISSEDRFSYSSSLGFGAFIRQVYSPLLSGAAIVCFPNKILKAPLPFLNALHDKQISLFNAPPILLQKIAETAQQNQLDADFLSKVRLVLAGGDLFPKKIKEFWFNQFQHEHKIVNLYGSTESIVNASSYFVSSGQKLNQEYLPIGKARKDLCFFLLDEKSKKITETNKAGELCIQSAFLAQAYHNNPEESRKVFKLSDKAENNIYKTGDRAVRLPSGDYLVLGRDDTQTQVYGQRVELGEIENHLNRHPQVNRAFALCLKQTEWNKIVVFIQSSGSSFDEKKLRVFLNQRLPSYMMPHYFYSLEEAPVDPSSGKISYKSLKKKTEEIWSKNNLNFIKQNTPPLYFSLDQKELEKEVKKLWKNYLGDKDFNHQESFFDLGGDSILAVNLYQDLCESFDVFLDPYIFYHCTTVEKIAQALISAKTKKTTDKTAPALKERKSFKKSLIALGLKLLKVYDSLLSFFYRSYLKKYLQSPQQKYFTFTKRLFGEVQNAYFSAPIDGAFDKDLFKKALDLVVKHQESLRTIFIGNQQLVLPEFPVDLLVYDFQSESPESQKNSIIKIENEFLKSNFDFSQLPLFKTALCELSQNRSQIIFCVNHVIGDGWSLQAFLTALDEAYCYLQGKINFLNNYSYLDYTKKYKLFCKDHFAVNQNYWNQKLSQINRFNLSDRFQNTAVDSSEEAFILKGPAFKKLNLFCDKNKIQNFYFYLFLWSQALRKFLDCQKIYFMTTYHNRDFPFKNINRLIGSIARMTSVFIEPDFQDDIKQNIELVKKSYLTTLKHKDFNIFKFLFENEKQNRNYIIFNYLDFQSLSDLTSHLPFSIQWNQSKVNLSFNKNAYNNIYLFLSIHNYKDYLEIKSYGKADSSQKKELMDIIKKEISSFDF